MKRIAEQDKVAVAHDSKLKWMTPKEGDLVMVRRHEVDKHKGLKLETRWDGPRLLVKLSKQGNSAIVKELHGRKTDKRYHVDDLKVYVSRQGHTYLTEGPSRAAYEEGLREEGEVVEERRGWGGEERVAKLRRGEDGGMWKEVRLLEGRRRQGRYGRVEKRGVEDDRQGQGKDLVRALNTKEGGVLVEGERDMSKGSAFLERKRGLASTRRLLVAGPSILEKWVADSPSWRVGQNSAVGASLGEAARGKNASVRTLTVAPPRLAYLQLDGVLNHILPLINFPEEYPTKPPKAGIRTFMNEFALKDFDNRLNPPHTYPPGIQEQQARKASSPAGYHTGSAPSVLVMAGSPNTSNGSVDIQGDAPGVVPPTPTDHIC
ncbi:hypothetical protein BGX38DRAFT_1330336 [Terfezia claveryi]|nr:hypothetical protein BGX38DRAFT_1330336 [Terfezia claveryi]